MDADGIEAWISRIHGPPESRGLSGANQEKLAKKILEDKAAQDSPNLHKSLGKRWNLEHRAMAAAAAAAKATMANAPC